MSLSGIMANIAVFFSPSVLSSSSSVIVSDERLSKKSSFFEKMRSRFLELFNHFTQKKLPSASTKIPENIVNEDEKKNEFKRMINANNPVWREKEAQKKVIEQQLQASKDTPQNRDNNDGFEIGD